MGGGLAEKLDDPGVEATPGAPAIGGKGKAGSAVLLPVGVGLASVPLLSGGGLGM